LGRERHLLRNLQIRREYDLTTRRRADVWQSCDGCLSLLFWSNLRKSRLYDIGVSYGKEQSKMLSSRLGSIRTWYKYFHINKPADQYTPVFTRSIRPDPPHTTTTTLNTAYVKLIFLNSYKDSLHLVRCDSTRSFRFLLDIKTNARRCDCHF